LLRCVGICRFGSQSMTSSVYVYLTSSLLGLVLLAVFLDNIQQPTSTTPPTGRTENYSYWQVSETSSPRLTSSQTPSSLGNVTNYTTTFNHLTPTAAAYVPWHRCKNVLEKIKKTVKNVKNVDKIKNV